MEKKLLWLSLFIVSAILYYLLFGGEQIIGNVIKSEFIKEEVIVQRVIDGDTLELEDSRRVRMLGVNTPEKKRFMSEEAINYTKQLEGKNVILEYNERDKYGRILGYIIYNGENINLGLLRNGLAHAYFYQEDIYFNKAKEIESLARNEERGIWTPSQHKDCLELLEFRYNEDGKRCSNKERLILENSCSELDVLIKDDATHEFSQKISTGVFSMNFSCTFNDVGDSLFIWDDSGLLIFYRY